MTTKPDIGSGALWTEKHVKWWRDRHHRRADLPVPVKSLKRRVIELLSEMDTVTSDDLVEALGITKHQASSQLSDMVDVALLRPRGVIRRGIGNGSGGATVVYERVPGAWEREPAR